MVNEIKGNMLEQENGILCHQTNYQGVMGGGIAAAIREKLLTEQHYKNYQDFCRKCGANALGYVQWLYLTETRILANCFCQNAFESPDADGTITNYAAMKECFEKVREFSEKYNLPVFIPGGMGCGIAGGNWIKVRSIIGAVFDDSKIPITIVWLEEA